MIFKEEFNYYKNTNEIFDLIKNEEWPVFLFSNNNIFSEQRYDIISANPTKKVITYQNATIVEDLKSKQVFRDDPISILKDVMKDDLSDDDSELPFSGGAIGYFSYDLGNKNESIKQKTNNDLDIPIMAFGIYEWAVIIDHHEKKIRLIYKNKTDLIKFLQKKLSSKSFEKIKNVNIEIINSCQSNLTYDEYIEKFNLIKSYIEKGDCYQINFSQRFSFDYKGDAWNIFNKLLPTYHSPYSAYMSFPFVKILSYSPERFLHVDRDLVQTKPIKGTRPMINNIDQDSLIKKELLLSEKDRAENLMIVDLLRNDLGKNCEYGSIDVKNLFDIETFANVHHLVSTIEGRISNKSNMFNLINGCFPGGSITGAPKIRAMQIINELEPDRRGIYCGSIGYLSFNQKADLNIAIRTMIATDTTVYFWGGGGIVFDSDAESEYQETLDKVRPILDIFDSNVLQFPKKLG